MSDTNLTLIGLDQLESTPYNALSGLRASAPVAWVPALNAWLVTRRDLAVTAMRDAETFTVDDPRFSTAAVLGDSMLNLDGPEHTRHRGAFAPHFRPKVVREQFEEWLTDEARRLVTEAMTHAGASGDGSAELRTQLAGPLAVNTIVEFLGLAGVTSDDVLRWYYRISEAIVDVSVGKEIAAEGQAAVASIYERVNAVRSADPGSGPEPLVQTIEAEAILRSDEITPETVVVMFGAIETSEGMTANCLWHLLTHPDQLARVAADRSLVSAAVEESLRLEPAAAVVDRYATRALEFGGAQIDKGDLVTISLLGANRDPSVFTDPDIYDIDRTNLGQHVTFVQGPHGCLGLHLARLETVAAVNAVLDLMPGITLREGQSNAPRGLIFRKPAAVTVTW